MQSASTESNLKHAYIDMAYLEEKKNKKINDGGILNPGQGRIFFNTHSMGFAGMPG